MYVPAAFRIEDLAEIQAAIAAARLAQFVTVGPEGPEATPLPLFLDPAEGPYGTLYGHLARANPQWRAAAPGAAGLAIFTGPEAYVTPAWYAAKAETGKVVPTWNYETVQARGPVEFFDDEGRLHEVVRRLTELHEAGRPQPWAVSDAPEPFVRAQLRGIVGLRLQIAALTGKRKMSQNRSAEDRAGVAAGLEASPVEAERRAAGLIPR